jgi:hypothetical protein
VQTPVIAALPLPVFVRLTRQTSGAPEQDTEPAETKATLVNVPIKPKTNPAIAMAAKSVIAISMMVASTGETAFLFFLRAGRFIVRRIHLTFSY